ncbi:hypothetical protein EAF04_007844 [Stromatinia cepivora]|nr:hypothetical protein EAF04_007844 [Stromatinia cepivora]
MALMYTISHLDSTATIILPYDLAPTFTLTDEAIKFILEHPEIPYPLMQSSTSSTSPEIEIFTFNIFTGRYPADVNLSAPPPALDNYAKFFGDLYLYPNHRWKDLLIILGILNLLVLSMGILVRVMKSVYGGCASGDVDYCGEIAVKGQGGGGVGSEEDRGDSEEEEIDSYGEMVDEQGENND